MTDGEKLRKLLVSSKKSQAELARKLKMNPSNVTHWIEMEEFTDKLWQKISGGLQRIGLDPTVIKPLPVDDDQDEAGPVRDWRPEVEGWGNDKLMTLKGIIKSNKASRTHLLFWLEGYLTRRH